MSWRGCNVWQLRNEPDEDAVLATSPLRKGGPAWLAERLGAGLQILIHRFKSGTGLVGVRKEKRMTEVAVASVVAVGTGWVFVNRAPIRAWMHHLVSKDESYPAKHRLGQPTRFVGRHAVTA